MRQHERRLGLAAAGRVLDQRQSRAVRQSDAGCSLLHRRGCRDVGEKRLEACEGSDHGRSQTVLHSALARRLPIARDIAMGRCIREGRRRRTNPVGKIYQSGRKPGQARRLSFPRRLISKWPKQIADGLQPFPHSPSTDRTEQLRPEIAFERFLGWAAVMAGCGAHQRQVRVAIPSRQQTRDI